MPKTKKSKKNIKKSNEKISISSLCNISGIQDELDPFASTNNELDDCLALMDQSLETTNTTETTKKESQASSSVIATTNLWKVPSSSSKSHAADNFSLPNIQVELARHKHIADLSKYLLSKAKHLRMPSFERWLLDSKMEERTKRMLIQEQANVESHQKKQDKKIKRLKRKRKDLQSNLERHLSSSGLRVQIDFDCVIPTMADVEDDASERLEQEIKAGFDNDDDEKDERMSPQEIVRELCDMACKAGRHLQNLSQHLGEVHSDHYFGNKSHSTTSSRIVLEVANNNSTDETQKSNDSEKDSKTYSLVYSRKAKGDGKKPKPFVVKINADHYEKLRIMFHHVHDTTKSTRPLHVPPALTIGTNPKQYSPATHIFHHLVFCMLIRYASLAGAQQLLDLRGGGMQGAIHSQVFDCIAQQGYENVMECFASPLNVYNSQYFSIFHQDLDVHFGSCGDFFSIPYNYFRKGGVHEANPPFSPCLMTKMIEKMEEHLMFADVMSSKGKECPLTFVVVVPSCSSKSRENLVQQFAWTSFNAMLRSRFMSRHIVLGARQHGYVEGAQHMRPTRFKESQYDTSVIILQSKDARKKAKDFAGNEFETLEAARLQKEEEELAKLEAEAEAERLRVEAKIQAEKEASKMRMQQLEEERKRLELERQAMTLKAEEEEQARINAQNELARLKAEQADRQKFLEMQMTIDEGHSFDMSQLPLEEKPIVSDEEEESTAPFETEEEETLSTYESNPEIFAFAERPSSAGSNRLSRPGSASLQRKRRQQQRTENALQGMLAKMSSSMSLRSDDRSVTSFSTVETSLVSHTRNLSSENVKWESINIPVWFGLLTNEYGAPREGQYTPSMSNNHTLLKNILNKMSTISKKVIEQENASGNMVMKCELPFISRIERDSNFHDTARPDVIRNVVYVSIPVKMTDINEQMNSTAERMARVMICRSLRKSVERKYFS